MNFLTQVECSSFAHMKPIGCVLNHWKFAGLSSLFLLLIASCYGPIETSKASFKDSTLVTYDYYANGNLKARVETEHKSARRSKVVEKHYLPLNPVPDGDSTGPDTVEYATITHKRFRIDENIYVQKTKIRSFYDGAQAKKERTKKRSKFRDGCEIVTYKRTKMYDEAGKVVFKENFNFLYWRQVRKIYDEQGKRIKNRTIRFEFKPKFRNYP